MKRRDREQQEDRPTPPRNLRGERVAQDAQQAHEARDRLRAKRSQLAILKAVRRKGHWWPGE